MSFHQLGKIFDTPDAKIWRRMRMRKLRRGEKVCQQEEAQDKCAKSEKYEEVGL